jgi:uncharacterized membrane protein YkoI
MTNGRPGTAALIALTAALSLAFSPVYANQHKGRSKDTESASAQISADQAAAVARSATGGRVLKVELKGRAYQIRVLLDGKRIRNVRVDAQTGQLLN